MLMQGLGLKQGDDMLTENARKFQQLYKAEWSVRVSSASLRSLADNKFNKEELLPLTTDLLLIKKYCLEQIPKLVLELKCPTVETWRKLAEIVLTRITIFNKRRGNEPSSILLKRYVTRSSHAKVTHSDIYDSLSELEKKLLDR